MEQTDPPGAELPASLAEHSVGAFRRPGVHDRGQQVGRSPGGPSRSQHRRARSAPARLPRRDCSSVPARPPPCSRRSPLAALAVAERSAIVLPARTIALADMSPSKRAGVIPAPVSSVMPTRAAAGSATSGGLARSAGPRSRGLTRSRQRLGSARRGPGSRPSPREGREYVLAVGSGRPMRADVEDLDSSAPRFDAAFDGLVRAASRSTSAPGRHRRIWPLPGRLEPVYGTTRPAVRLATLRSRIKGHRKGVVEGETFPMRRDAARPRPLGDARRGPSCRYRARAAKTKVPEPGARWRRGAGQLAPAACGCSYHRAKTLRMRNARTVALFKCPVFLEP